MEYFRDLPISKKINWAILLTGVGALFVAGFAITTLEFISFRRGAESQLISVAGIVGTNCTGALAFQDKEAANEILLNLEGEASLLGARIYDRHGLPFASFIRSGVQQEVLPATALPDQEIKDENHLKLFQSIRYKGGEPIGTIYLDSSLHRLYVRLLRYAGIILLVIALLVPVVLMVSIRLQRIITSPIRDLAALALQVADKKDYSVRARKLSSDEIGQLTDTFNHMLESIELRDTRLVQQADELWRSNKELEQFAYVSSHDLQEPLRKVTVYAQLLEEDTKRSPSPNTRKYVENITLSVSRMRSLIQDLLAYSRLQNPEIKREKVDLNELVKQLINEMDISISQKRATVTVGSLPMVEANTSQMSQVFQNLLSNALKFHGDAPPRIKISGEERNGEALIRVSDDGIGIDEKYKDQIFKIFQRLHGKNEFPGTGIGLAICKKIIEQYGGKIWVESTLGKGATFLFTVPKSENPLEAS